jgi:competence protein ComEA
MADRLGISPFALVVGAAAVVVAGVGGWWALRPPPPPAPEEVLPRVDDGVGPVAAVATTTTEPAVTMVVVHVDGAVAVPGVHELRPGARVDDAIAAAGGLTAAADRERLNLAAPVADGQRVWVPRRGEDEPPVVTPVGGGPADPSGPGAPAAPVDLNTADAAALETLPGVGPTIAAAIIRHRETEGRFDRVDDLLAVAGIGPSRLAVLEGLVTV